MKQPGHRIADRLGKAALKTHALQTLRDRRASPNRAKRLECVRFIRFIGAFRPARDGPRFMGPMQAKHPTSNLQAAPGWDTAPYREMIHGRYPREKSRRG